MSFATKALIATTTVLALAGCGGGGGGSSTATSGSAAGAIQSFGREAPKAQQNQAAATSGA